MTAVEWLETQMLNVPIEHLGYYRNKFEQAKEMEKEQLKDAYWNGTLDMEKEDAMSEAEDFYNAYYSK